MKARVVVVDPKDGSPEQVYFRQPNPEGDDWQVDRPNLDFHIRVEDPERRSQLVPGQIWEMEFKKVAHG